MSGDIDGIVYIVHKHQLQASVSGSEVRYLSSWLDRWCNFNSVVVSTSASGPGDIKFMEAPILVK